MAYPVDTATTAVTDSTGAARVDGLNNSTISGSPTKVGAALLAVATVLDAAQSEHGADFARQRLAELSAALAAMV